METYRSHVISELLKEAQERRRLAKEGRMAAMARAMTAEEGKRMERAAHRLLANESLAIRDAMRGLSFFTEDREQRKRVVLERAGRRKSI